MRYAVVLLLLGVLAACTEREPRPVLVTDPAPQPVIVVTKSEISYQGKLIESSPPESCLRHGRLEPSIDFQPRNVDATALLFFMMLGVGVGALFTVRQSDDARRTFERGASIEIDRTLALRVLHRRVDRAVVIILCSIAAAVGVALAPTSLFGGYDNSATVEARLALFVAPAVIATVQLTIALRLRHAIAAMTEWTTARFAERYLYVARNRSAISWAAVSPREIEPAIPKATARR